MLHLFHTLFSGKYYQIPHNQRGFSWGEEQILAALHDLELAGTQAHYMGTVIVSRDTTEPVFQTDDLVSTAKFTLEDGQQRITTFFLIANSIRKNLVRLGGGTTLKKINEIESVLFYEKGGQMNRLQNENPSLNECLSHILTGRPSLPAVRTPPMKAMLAASRFLDGHFAGKTQLELIDWANKIFNQAKFVWIDLEAESVNKYLAFDAINSRGLPLSEFDKAKNFCILINGARRLGLVPEDEWYAAISHLEFFGVGNRSLESACIAELYGTFFGEQVGHDGTHDRLVKKFTSLLVASDGALEDQFASFVGTWEKWTESFAFLSSPSRHNHYGTMCTAQAGEWLDRLTKMDLSGICRALLSACHVKFDQADFEVVARACEIYTFRVHAVMGYRKDKNSNGLLHLARRVLLEDLQKDQVLKQLCDWLSQLAPLEKVVKEIFNGSAKYNFDSAIRGWLHTYYFLYEYELSNSPAGVAPLPWGTSREQKVSTQEHILPQSRVAGGWWETHWPDESEAEKFKHRLGNLVLTNGNSSLGRKGIALKLSDPAADYSYSHPQATNSEKRIRHFTDGTHWRPRNILDRELEMAQFATDRWSMPCCSDNGAIELPDEFTATIGTPQRIVVNYADCIVVRDDGAAVDANEGPEDPNAVEPA